MSLSVVISVVEAFIFGSACKVGKKFSPPLVASPIPVSPMIGSAGPPPAALHLLQLWPMWALACFSLLSLLSLSFGLLAFI